VLEVIVFCQFELEFFFQFIQLWHPTSHTIFYLSPTSYILPF
jgi:hypothetical protein